MQLEKFGTVAKCLISQKRLINLQFLGTVFSSCFNLDHKTKQKTNAALLKNREFYTIQTVKQCLAIFVLYIKHVYGF